MTRIRHMPMATSSYGSIACVIICDALWQLPPVPAGASWLQHSPAMPTSEPMHKTIVFIIEMQARGFPLYQNLTMSTRTLLSVDRLAARLVLLKPHDNTDDSEREIVGNTIMVVQPRRKMIASTLLMHTSNAPVTEGYKTTARHMGDTIDLNFRAFSGYFTTNFPDTSHQLTRMRAASFERGISTETALV